MADYKKKFRAMKAAHDSVQKEHKSTQKKYKVAKVGFVATALAAGALAFNTYSPGTFDKLLKDVTKWIKDNPQK